MHPNYLQLFAKALRTEDSTKRESLFQEMNASPEVKASINQTVTSMSKDGLTFFLEPQEATISTEHKGNTIVYKGDFIYGFEKDQVFHDIPGDLSTKTTKEVNNPNSEVIFTINPENNQLESIYESMAANTFGKQPKTNLAKPAIFIIVIIALIIFIITNS